MNDIMNYDNIWFFFLNYFWYDIFDIWKNIGWKYGGFFFLFFYIRTLCKSNKNAFIIPYILYINYHSLKTVSCVVISTCMFTSLTPQGYFSGVHYSFFYHVLSVRDWTVLSVYSFIFEICCPHSRFFSICQHILISPLSEQGRQNIVLVDQLYSTR